MVETLTPESLELPKLKSEAPDKYFSIPQKILQVDTIPGFNIFLPAQGKKDHALYRSGSDPFREEHRKKLTQDKVLEIFIKTSDRRLYSQYIEDYLTEIISDPSFSAEKKSKMVYDCSTELLQNIFTKTQIADKIPSVSSVVKSTVEYLSEGVREFLTMLDAMSHDYYTTNHSVNVCTIGLALGQRIGLKGQELNELGIGLLLHDLGKSKIDESILKKKGPLNEQEWKIMKKHPKNGAAIAEGTKRVMPLSLTVIRQHHEKCTGKGYPMGLYEPQIHLFGHIAALADVYDALTTVRPYNAALQGFPAIQLMQKEMADDFSRDLFKELVLLLNERPKDNQ